MQFCHWRQSNHMVKFCLQTKIQQHIHQPILGYRLHRVYGNLCHSTTILSNQYHSGQTIKTNFINNSALINSVADWVCCKWPEWLGKISGCVVQVLEPHSLHARTREIIRCPYRCLSALKFSSKVKPYIWPARGKFLCQFCAISLQKQAIFGEMWQ